MLNVEKILFPTDLTPLAEDAFTHAGRLAALWGAEVHVLNVAAPHEEEERAPTDFLPLVEQEEQGEQFFLPVEGGGLTRAHDAVPVHYRLVPCASPVMAILEYADDEEVDLIVMATRGRTGLSRLLDGSVAEAVVREARCPTLTVRAGTGPWHPARRILAPVDFSEQTERQLACARALAETHGAALDLLHVVEATTPPAEYGPEALEYASASQGETVQELVREALGALGGEGEQAAEVHVAAGHPVAEITRFAEEEDADLVVMGTRGRTGLEHLLIGSVAERVVRTASCPVFVVRMADESPAAGASEPSEHASAP